MFPIAADWLPLAEIAALWAEEITPRRTPAKVQLFLERAFWRGEFHCDGPSRLDVLRRSYWGPLVPDGDRATWMEEECRLAFEFLADHWPYVWVHDGEVKGRGGALNYDRAFNGVGLSRASFMAWVSAKGYNRPTFWGAFPPDAETTSDAIIRRRPGRDPKLRKAVVARMQADIEAGAITPQQLANMIEKQLVHRYHCRSRDTARKARREILGWV